MGAEQGRWREEIEVWGEVVGGHRVWRAASGDFRELLDEY